MAKHKIKGYLDDYIRAFKGDFGDLVLFTGWKLSRKDSESYDLVGFVVSHIWSPGNEDVYLSNRKPWSAEEQRHGDGRRKIHSIPERCVGEKIYVASLNHWQEYEILRKYKPPKSIKSP